LEYYTTPHPTLRATFPSRGRLFKEDNMTLGEAKNKVYMLLDEHSAGGEVEHDEDIELKMVFFFDMAQKALSQIKKIVKVRKITAQSGKTEYAMPGDFMGVYRVWRDEKPATGRYRFRGGKMIIPERDAGSEIQVEYFAFPETIPADADDSYEFEISADACECMPYYVAAQQLLPDLVMDYGSMLMMFNQAVALLDTRQPGENARISQTFFN
jgi:hypothetical protein